MKGFDSQQLHRLRKLTGLKDVYVNGELHAEGINGSQESIIIPVPHPGTQIKVEVREHGRPYSRKKSEQPEVEPEAKPAE